MNIQQMIEEHPGLAIGGAVILGVGFFIIAGKGGNKVIPATAQSVDQSAGTSNVGADQLQAALAAQSQHFQDLLDQQANFFYQQIYGYGSGEQYQLPTGTSDTHPPLPNGHPGPSPVPDPGGGDPGGSGHGGGIHRFGMPDYKASVQSMVLN